MTRQSAVIIIVAAIAILALAIIAINYENKVLAASVIFRLDDVQDGFASNGTKGVMDLFLAKKVPLTTGIIAAAIGKDTAVVNLTGQGIKSGLFEAALHGYRHVDYSQLTPNNQSVTMTQGNTVIKQLFGVHPWVFVPPFNTFNSATLSAMKQHDMNIISSTLGTESSQNDTNKIYNSSQTCGSTEAGVVCENPVHVSAANDFRIISDANITQQSNQQLLKQIADNIRHYGYSVLVLHPQDFVQTDNVGKVIKNQINAKQIAQLSELVDSVRKKYTPTSMTALVKEMKGAANFEVRTSEPIDKTKQNKQIVLTLDDDWIGQVSIAMPILQQHKFNATWFVTCKGPTHQDKDFTRIDYVNDKQKQSKDITTWSDVKLVKSNGFDLENHGMTHTPLVDASAKTLKTEILDSKQCFAQHLGFQPTVYAPAFAKPVDNVTVNQYITKGGYEFARNDYGPGHFSSQRFALPTMSMNELDKKFDHKTQLIMQVFAQQMKDAELPVLVYHNVNYLNATADNWKNSTTTPETFLAEMNWLQSNGYTVHSIRDLKWDSDKGEFRFK